MSGLIRDTSQESRIETLLRARGGDGWVSALDLSAISLQYCRAICCLRRRGVRIENKVEMKGRVRHGFYRLARGPAVQVPLLAMPVQQWRDPEESERQANFARGRTGNENYIGTP